LNHKPRSGDQMAAVPCFQSRICFNASARYCDEPDFLQWRGRLAGFAQPVISFFRAITESNGLSIDDSPGSWSGILMSGAAGIAAALAVAMILIAYFRSGYRTVRDIARHGLAAVVVLGLLAFVATTCGMPR